MHVYFTTSTTLHVFLILIICCLYLKDNVTRLLSRLDALQALTGTASQHGSDERVELLDAMQLPRSTANAKLACNRIMSNIYTSIQVHTIPAFTSWSSRIINIIKSVHREHFFCDSPPPSKSVFGK